MRKMKKILAFVMAMAMVLGMSVTAFATEPADGTETPPVTKNVPSENDKADVKVLNVENGATVTAYQIVKANYKDGFAGYEAVLTGSIADKLTFQPTSDEIVALAKRTNELTNHVELTGTPDTNSEGKQTGFSTYTGKLAAGYWMVLVTGSVDEVYNPMLLGVYYTPGGDWDDNTLATPDDVNADGMWELVTENAYAKSTAPSIDKTITGSVSNPDEQSHAPADKGGDDVAVGDTVNFKIETAIPSYSKQYEEVVVKITDTLSGGLKIEDSSKVKVLLDGEEKTKTDTVNTDAENETFKVTVSDDGKALAIEFDSDYALENSGKKVTVTYDAKLVEEGMKYNFDSNTNKVKLEYSNDPADSSKTKETEDETYTYTFGIDAELYGPEDTQKPWNKVTEELIKGEIKKVINTEGVETEEFVPLTGATFTLTNTVTGKVYTTDSNEKGQLSFKGLDAGSYNLVETKAPDGYSLNDTVIPIVIAAHYDEDGRLADYSITINGKKTAKYEATYTADESTGKKEITNITTKYLNDKGEEITLDEAQYLEEILNTKLSKLPSTGGIGTTIFTIGGCAIMILAAGLFFASRRKAEK